MGTSILTSLRFEKWHFWPAMGQTFCTFLWFEAPNLEFWGSFTFFVHIWNPHVSGLHPSSSVPCYKARAAVSTAGGVPYTQIISFSRSSLMASADTLASVVTVPKGVWANMYIQKCSYKPCFMYMYKFHIITLHIKMENKSPTCFFLFSRFFFFLKQFTYPFAPRAYTTEHHKQ